MRTPFTVDQFFGVFVRYHESLWPAPLVLFPAGCVLASIALLAPRQSRFVFGGLAALWAWMAIAYHFAFFTALTPAAFVFGAFLLVEALLLAWHGLRTRRLHLATSIDRPARLVGSALLAYAIVGYPAVALLAGQRYPAMPTFGLPCPTTIFTFGLLAWCVRPVPWSVLIIPAAWALIGTSGAMSFGVAEDFGLPVAAVLALAVILRPVARHPHEAPKGGRPLQLGF